MTSSRTISSTPSCDDEQLPRPSSPFSDPEQPILPVDDLGMIADDEHSPEKIAPSSGPGDSSSNNTKHKRGKRRKITYVSKHFADQGHGKESPKPLRAPRKRTKKPRQLPESEGIAEPPLSTPLSPVAEPHRVYYGYNIDEFSSDSSLTDVPDDIDTIPDPFIKELVAPSTVSGVRARKLKAKKIRSPTKSPYFPLPHKHRPTFLSTLPFPPLAHDTFGLMQERLAHDPFRLLIATIFLNKTPGERAMPIFYQLVNRYPTPADLAAADVSDITAIIYVLGFQNQRARKCVEMAKVWIDTPPQAGKRYRKLNYPNKGDGRNIKEGDIVDDSDSRVGWEITHLPGLGPYSHDSWRMFCRDKLRGLSSGWNGENAANPGSFEPEWKRVVPLDKELRAYLTWMWMKEGWVWNKETGQRTRASDELMAEAQGGGIVVEEKDSSHLIVKSVKEEDVDTLQDKNKVEHTAGDFLPAPLLDTRAINI